MKLVLFPKYKKSIMDEKYSCFLNRLRSLNYYIKRFGSYPEIINLMTITCNHLHIPYPDMHADICYSFDKNVILLMIEGSVHFLEKYLMEAPMAEVWLQDLNNCLKEIEEMKVIEA